MKKVFVTLLFLVVGGGLAWAQTNWKWPEDKATAKEKNVLYSDYVKMGSYKEAVPPMQWLLREAPDLHPSLYKNGAKIYDNLAKAEQDPAKKAQYIDSLLWMYDMRMKYFQDSANVMNRKAFKAYKYYVKDFDKAEWLLDLYDNTFRLAGDKVMTQNLLAYMNVIKVNKLVKKNLTDDEVLERYDKISTIIDHKMKELEAKGSSTDKLKKQKDLIDKVLTEIVKIDCAFIEEKLGPKFKETPDDIQLVKRMFGFMLTYKCTDSPLFLDVAKQLNKLEPDFGVAKLVGTRCLAAGDFACAKTYYDEALTLTEDGIKRAQIYTQLGKMETKKGNKVAARSYYQKALSEDPSNKEPWVLIGDLYFHSFEQCANKKSKVEDRLVFIAAYNMYKRGGDVAKMKAAKAQFPSKEEVFNDDYTVGQTLTVGCWINEKVTLATRD